MRDPVARPWAGPYRLRAGCYRWVAANTFQLEALARPMRSLVAPVRILALWHSVRKGLP